MKIARLRQPGGLDNVEIAEGDRPGKPGPGEVLVRVRASSLNYHDLLVIKGAIPTVDGRVLLSDAACEVIEAGDGVGTLKAGDAVLSTFYPAWVDGPPRQEVIRDVPGDGADGYACEYVVAPATAFVRAPKGVSFLEAATLPCAGLTAWRALVVEGGLKAGDTVLVQGTGGVSLFALAIAKTMGARVIATSSSDEKLERLKALGADETLNYAAQPEWGPVVRDLSGGGVDHVVEIGGAGTLTQSIHATRFGGHISVIGVLTGREAVIPTVLMMFKQLRTIGVSVGSKRALSDLAGAVETSALRPVIDRTFGLDALVEAARYQESGAHFGKIAIDIAEGGAIIGG